MKFLFNKFKNFWFFFFNKYDKNEILSKYIKRTLNKIKENPTKLLLV